MKKNFVTFMLCGCLLLASCQKQAVGAPADLTGPTAENVENPTMIPTEDFSMDEVMNAAVTAPQGQKIFQLEDGKYESGSGADYAQVTILPQSTMGDINGDGKLEAAVLLSENYGGSGVFVSLIVFQKVGDSLQQSPAILIDDRPVINKLSIADGKIVLDAVIHGENDPMAAPSLGVIESYQVYGSTLALTGLSEDSSGTEQKIVIDQPLESESVSGEISIKGSMPVAPFENSLRYRFYDSNNTVLNEGSFMVSAEDVGKPATIEQTLTLPVVSSGSKIRLELAYLSAKDGSPMCMTSVDLTVK